jgi:hypothetical protein
MKRPARDEVPEIPVRENLQGCSRLVTATRIELGRVKLDKYGLLDVRQTPAVYLSQFQKRRSIGP